jgi:Hsp20/alpha crystallin family
VTVESGLLTIRAERHEETMQDRHSEFRYGSLSRTVALPEVADADKITARYDARRAPVGVKAVNQSNARPARPPDGGRAGVMAGALLTYS